MIAAPIGTNTVHNVYFSHQCQPMPEYFGVLLVVVAVVQIILLLGWLNRGRTGS